MHDNMLVNVSGLPGHAMGMDLNIEHIIQYLKVQFGHSFKLYCHLLTENACLYRHCLPQGIYANWERLGNISAAVNYLQLIKTKVA
jgi:hypothetical protein